MAKEKEPVTLIEDPFALPNLAVEEAQRSGEELDLDEDFEAEDGAEVEATMARLGGALAEEHKKNMKELEEQTRAGAGDLASQIAEDVAVERAAAEARDSEEDPGVSSSELDAALPRRLESGEADPEDLESCVEAMLFIADKPLSLNKLREYLGSDIPPAAFRKAIDGIKERYAGAHHGIEIANVAGGFEFRTKAHRAPLLRKLVKVQAQRLSRGAMETLAITAYRQPVMKEDIDKVRGVDSTHFIRTLLERGLIEMAGRSELPGRPILYRTNDRFLEVFGLADLTALPPLRELEQMVPASQSGEGDEDPKAKAIRTLVKSMHEQRGGMDYDPREDERFLTEIRERVESYSTTTPYLKETEEAERAAAADAVLAKEQPELSDAPKEGT